MSQLILDGGNAQGFTQVSVQIANYTCQQVLFLVSQQLQDATNVQWGITPKMLPYMNLGCKEVVNIKPEANTYIVVTPLQSGARQSLPPGAIFLVGVESVVDASGNPVSSVTLVDRMQMDKLLPNWYSFPGGDAIQYVIKDDRNPNNFYVFPHPPGSTTQSAMLICAVYPADVTSLLMPDGLTQTTFPLDNEYIQVLVDYIIYRCLVEETTIPNAQAKAGVFYQKFLQGLGLGKSAKKASDQQGV